MSCQPFTIARGEAKLHRLQIFEADGITPRPVFGLITPGTKVDIYQIDNTCGAVRQALRKTFTLGIDPEIYPSPASGEDHVLVLEYTAEFTATLKPGALTESWTFKSEDPAFVADDDIRTDKLTVGNITIQ